MRVLKIVTLVAFTVSLLGCSTSGGTIGGLFPAPKFTKGNMADDIYTSKDNDFSVSIPHKKGTSEYTYMKIKEQYNEYGSYVSFGPAALDLSIYRLEIGKKLSPESHKVVFEDAVDTLIVKYSEQIEAGYNSKPEFISKEKTQVNGVESYIVKLEQQVNEHVRLDHELIFCNYETMAVMFWVELNSSSLLSVDINALEFAQSFKILN